MYLVKSINLCSYNRDQNSNNTEAITLISTGIVSIILGGSLYTWYRFKAHSDGQKIYPKLTLNEEEIRTVRINGNMKIFPSESNEQEVFNLR